VVRRHPLPRLVSAPAALALCAGGDRDPRVACPGASFRNRRVLLSRAGHALLDGVAFVPLLVREDLGIVGQKRNGEWINDFKQMKMVDSVWPKIEGAPIRIRVGFRETVKGPLTWQNYVNFNPATDLWVNAIVDENLPGCGKAVSIEFTANTGASWRLDGYAMNIEVIGPY